MPLRHEVAAALPEEVVPLTDDRQARRDAFAWGASRRREFWDRVHYSLEYTMERQGLDCCERDHRRDQTDRWLDQLREGTRFEDWAGSLFQRAALTPEQEQAREDAKERAENLLRSALSSKQLKELEARDYFHVTVGRRRFRITRGRSHNIKEVDARSRVLRTLCAHPKDQVPDADTMLAQKFLLETRAKEFFKIANVMTVRRLRRRATEGEATAMAETERAEETMTILEQAALDVTAGVQPVEAEPTVTGDVRAA